MNIRSDKEYIMGQPRLDGHRFSIASVVINIMERGLEYYVDELQIPKAEVMDAVDYCRDEMCDSNAWSYCHGCSKNKDYPGMDIWKVAENLKID